MKYTNLAISSSVLFFLVYFVFPSSIATAQNKKDTSRRMVVENGAGSYISELRRNEDGKLLPAEGYEWINPDDPKDTRVRLKSGLIRNGARSLRPAPGYEWLKPDDEKDLSVRLKPGLTRDEQGNLRPSDGYEWVNPSVKESMDVRLKVTSVPFNGIYEPPPIDRSPVRCTSGDACGSVRVTVAGEKREYRNLTERFVILYLFNQWGNPDSTLGTGQYLYPNETIKRPGVYKPFFMAVFDNTRGTGASVNTNSAANSSQTICIGKAPPGWIRMDTSLNLTVCPSAGSVMIHNQMTIERYDNKAIGAIMVTCIGTPPVGWVRDSVSLDPTKCQQTNMKVDNLMMIRRVQ